MAEPQRGAGVPQWPLSPYQINVQYASGSAAASSAPGGIASTGISRGDGADWFGPLNPLTPIAPADIAGRRFDFPVSYNLVTQPRAYEPIGFHELRGFADAYDLLRLVIETRKDQMERQRWRIRPRDPKFKRKSAAIDTEMSARIAAVEVFFQKPDGLTRWKTWLRSLLEDMFVIDAATLYCQRTRAGKLCALQQLDGATVKRLIDDWGRTPQPYAAPDGAMVFPPAYQQVLKGLPAVNYAARDIIYRPRNVRAHRVYGYSPVQQVLMTVNIALRRQLWQLDYYSEGSIPDALIGVPQGWTPDQIKQFQDYWDTEFSGDLAKRRRAKFVPGETAARVVQTKEPEQKNDFDEWLARIVCYAFSVPPQWAVKAMNRATADNQSAQAEDEGLEPTKEWVKDLIDEIIADEFTSPDLELVWLDEDTDAKDDEAQFEARVKIGAATLNELRDALGLDPFDTPAADQPMVLTATGYVPIDANVNGQGAAALAAPESANGWGSRRTNASQQNVPLIQKYNADQPRVPAGNQDGGQWTQEGADSAAGNSEASAANSLAPTTSAETIQATGDLQNLNDASRVISDAAPEDRWIPGALYAANEGIKGPFEGTTADLRAIAILGASRAAFTRFDFSQDPVVNSTSLRLAAILVTVMEANPPNSGATPQQYGTFIHLEFADAVRSERIPGIGYGDVETTFPEEDGYGAPGTIRTDVVLRNVDGTVRAIYDVKTGDSGLAPARVSRLREKTGAGPDVPVVELRLDEVLQKALADRIGLEVRVL
jgi:hypothetical protein